MKQIHRVDDSIDKDGYVIHGYSWWLCDCGRQVHRFRGQSDVDCMGCGACYNACGQRLRDDWRGNRSNYDEDVSDLDGYEQQYAGD